MSKIGIIGGGFTGTMTAVQIIEKSIQPCKIVIFNKKNNLGKGIAYDCYSKKQLLNVITAKMSVYPDRPSHFTEWVMVQDRYKSYDEKVISNAFLPRYLYGEYLVDVWAKALEDAKSKGISVEIVEDCVTDIDHQGESVQLTVESGKKYEVERCIIASGNQIPQNPRVENPDFYNSKKYFQNPWSVYSVTNIKNEKAVLIIGNGLTMVDTVLGLLEFGFKGEIYSISPNGFNILPHRHNGLAYSKLTEELPEKISLLDLVKLINKHVKMVREFGISAEPVIDSIRPHTQRIWKNLTDAERRLFMSRLRHLWGVARHRIPLHIHDKIQQLRIDGKLHIISGKLQNFTEHDNSITVDFFNKKTGKTNQIEVSRVINCSGPDSNIMNFENSFLKKGLEKGMITQDNLKLGVKTDTNTYEIINAKDERVKNIFTIGPNLKGELWESTAVNELRTQAQKLAELIING